MIEMGKYYGMFYVSLANSASSIIPIIIISIIAILVCVNQMIARGASWFEIITTTVVLIIGMFLLLFIFSVYGSTTIGCAFGMLNGLMPILIFFISLYLFTVTGHHTTVGLLAGFSLIIILIEIILGIIFGTIEMALKFPLAALFVAIIIALILNPEWQGNFFLLLAVLLLLSAVVGVAVTLAGCIGAVVYVVSEILRWISNNLKEIAQTVFAISILGLVAIFFDWIYSFFMAVLLGILGVMFSIALMFNLSLTAYEFGWDICVFLIYAFAAVSVIYFVISFLRGVKNG